MADLTDEQVEEAACEAFGEYARFHKWKERRWWKLSDAKRDEWRAATRKARTMCDSDQVIIDKVDNTAWPMWWNYIEEAYEEAQADG